MNIQEYYENLPDWVAIPWVLSTFKVFAILLIGFPLVGLIVRIVRKLTHRKLNVQSSMLVTKAVKYALYILLILTLLSQFGVNLAAILGAAGVAGVAIGFASQTSLSNVISGLFLIGERPFRVGDFIEADGTVGTVDAINLLSCTLRTTDNKMVRIPNETLVKNKLTNISRYPIRRCEIEVGVSYEENVGEVLDIFKKIIQDNPLCLDEPEALLLFQGFGDSSLNFKVGAWCEQSDYLTVKNTLTREIKEHFDEAGIEIPFPHVTLATGKSAKQ